jgi:hypothetical protein
MSIQERFRDGIYTASHSFAMLYAHPKLLVYLGFAALIYFFAQVLVYNMPLIGFAGDEFTIFIGIQGLQYSLLEFSHWLYQGLLVIVTFVYGFIITFLNVCLIRHVLAIIYEDAERARIRVVLSKSWSAIGRIVVWSVLFTLMSLALRVITISTYSNKIAYSLGLVTTIIIVGCLSLLTFFVLPIIAVHNVTIWRAIKTSYKMVKSLIVEIIGAECWIGIIALLIFIPLAIIIHVFGQGAGGASLIGSLIATLVMVLAGYIILSAQTVLRTKLYYHYVQPMEEMAFLSYPHF